MMFALILLIVIRYALILDDLCILASFFHVLLLIGLLKLLFRLRSIKSQNSVLLRETLLFLRLLVFLLLLIMLSSVLLKIRLKVFLTSFMKNPNQQASLFQFYPLILKAHRFFFAFLNELQLQF